MPESWTSPRAHILVPGDLLPEQAGQLGAARLSGGRRRLLHPCLPLSSVAVAGYGVGDLVDQQHDALLASGQVRDADRPILSAAPALCPVEVTDLPMWLKSGP